METAGFWNAVPEEVPTPCDCCGVEDCDNYIPYLGDKVLQSFFGETDVSNVCDGCLKKADESIDFLRFRFVQNGGVEA